MKFLSYAASLLSILSVLTIAAFAQTTFTNSAAITIADGTANGSGIGNPYPSPVEVSGLSGTVSDVNVKINRLSHTFVSDVALLLVAPNGRLMVIQSDAGNDGNLTDITYTLDDQAASALPRLEPLNAGTYKPTSFGDDDEFPVSGSNPPPSDCFFGAPCPQAAPAGTATLDGIFGGINPNGTWKLYAVDCCGDDTGVINGGWSIIITASGGGAAASSNAGVDMNGDGKTDFVVTRETTAPLAVTANPNFFNGVGKAKSYRERLQKRDLNRSADASLPRYWYVNTNGIGATTIYQFGTTDDFDVPEDYDGDGRDDIAVWRAGASNRAAFYILQSSNNTFRTELFGQDGDDPTVVGDYDGDKKADVATFRCPPETAAQCYFYYRGSLNNPARNITFIPFGFGINKDFYAAPGDYDGDGKADFCLQRSVSNGHGQFVLLRSSDFKVEYINWGLSSDTIVPGDFDGDKKSDFMVVRAVGSQLHWFLLTRTGGGTGANAIVWGLSATDYLTPGDYDGDGKQDVAVWRPNADPSQNYYLILRSGNSTFESAEWGMDGDYPVQSWNVH